jgi:hypothetical protein
VLRDWKKLTEGAAMNTHETSREGGLIRNGNGASTDEQKLVVQAKSGHSSAFGELYERHQLKIYRSAFRILRNEQDAEDAVQQSFQHAFVNLHRFRGDSAGIEVTSHGYVEICMHELEGEGSSQIGANRSQT